MADGEAPKTEAQGTGFFEESPNNKSMMRLACFLCIVWGSVICTGGAVVAAFKDTTQALTIFSIGISMIGTGLGGKVMQKYSETKAAQSEGE